MACSITPGHSPGQLPHLQDTNSFDDAVSEQAASGQSGARRGQEDRHGQSDEFTKKLNLSMQLDQSTTSCAGDRAWSSRLNCFGLNRLQWLRLLVYWAMFFLRPIGYSAIGIFLVEFEEDFTDATHEQISWIAACQLGAVPLICSLIIGWLVTRFSIRLVVAVSAIIGTMGLIISSLVKTLTALYIGYGVMLGWSSISYQIIGSILIQSIQSARRNLISGISYTIMSGGAFVWPAVCRLLIDSLGWQGTLQMLAAINLNILALAQLIPLDQPMSKSDDKFTADRKIVLDTKNPTVEDKCEKMKLNGSCTPDVIQQNGVTASSVSDEYAISDEPSHDHELQKNFVKKQNKGLNHSKYKNGEKYKCLKTSFDVSLTQTQMGHKSRNICGHPSYVLLIIYSIGHFFNQYTLFCVFVYLPVRCKEEGYSKSEAVLIISLVSIVGCVFRTPAGALGDLRQINPCFVTAVANFATGLSCIVSTWCTSLSGMLVCGGVIGAAVAFFVGLMNGSVEFLGGQTRLKMGFGLLNTAQGVCMLVGLPLSGIFLDNLGDTRMLFWILGCSTLIGGMLVLLAGVLRQISSPHQRWIRGPQS